MKFLWFDSLFSICSYNALERRESSKSCKDVSKKSAPSQPSTKNATAASKYPPHNGRRNDVPSTNSMNPSGKNSRPSSSGGPPGYSEAERTANEQQVLKTLSNCGDIEVNCDKS